jgi:restriction system protein
MSVPRASDLFNPLLTAIKRLGDSASIPEMDEEVTKNLNLTEEEIAQRHDNRYTELGYRLAWARSNLKAYGLLDNSERGVWVLTPKGRDTDSVDPPQVEKFLRNLNKNKKSKSNKPIDQNLKVDAGVVEIAEAVLEESWREELLARLLELSPALSSDCLSVCYVNPVLLKLK